MSKSNNTSDGVVQSRSKRAATLAAKRDALGARVLEALRDRNLKQLDLVQETGLSESVISHFLAGRYEKSAKGAFVALSAWLGEDNDEQPTVEPEPTEPGFIRTATAERVLNILSYCHSENDLGCVYGGPGIGKTMAALEYQSKYPNVFIMTGSPEVATVHPMLEELARTLGLEDCAGGSRGISRACRDRIKAAKKPLLIVDEAQHLNLGALESLRSIHDETKCGLVLAGNALVYERITGGARAAHFAQLYSRLGIQAHIKRPARTDITSIAAAWCLDDEPSVEMLVQIARRPGALRAAVKVLRLAIGAADGNVKSVRVEHVRIATRNLGLETIS